MHELSIAQNILEIVRQHAPDGRRVKAVRVAVGLLAGVVPDSLDFCFGVAAGGTPFESARLDIDEIPIRVLCRSCRSEFPVEHFAFACSCCGGVDLDMLSGTELKVVEIEMADPAPEVP